MAWIETRWWHTGLNTAGAVVLFGPAIIASGGLVQFGLSHTGEPPPVWVRWGVVWLQYGLAAGVCLYLPYLILRKTHIIVAASVFVTWMIGLRLWLMVGSVVAHHRPEDVSRWFGVLSTLIAIGMGAALTAVEIRKKQEADALKPPADVIS